MKPHLVFMGSPKFALPTLSALAENYSIQGVVTQPDRPAGRGKELTPPAIKSFAIDLGLPVIQPEKIKDPVAMQQLANWAPDLIVVVAYGQILRQTVLDLPRNGCINVHASLLPRWRGAAPIQAAILAGDEWAGVTIMRMDSGVDTGPILSQRGIPILCEDTAGSLSERLAEMGAELLIETLPVYLMGELQPRPQNELGVTYAPMLKKGDGQLDFTQSALDLARRVRAFNPWPGATTQWKGQPLRIHSAHAIEDYLSPPGQRLVYGPKPAIGTGQGTLVLDEVQPAGKKAMPGDVFLRGARDWEE